MPSVYQQIADYLAVQDGDEVHLSFEEIERLVGFPLPMRARTTGDIWTISALPHVAAWQAHGWRAQPRYVERCLVFRRIRDGE